MFQWIADAAPVEVDPGSPSGLAWAAAAVIGVGLLLLLVVGRLFDRG